MASTSSFRASSSSSTPSIPRTTTYDVFLSFRGEDTRFNFTDHLYSALGRRGISTFRDDKLSRGEAIAPELLNAIEKSRSSVIVFSENYARSRWCLDELVKIMECHKDLGHAVFPIFYHVDPSHVRKQEGSFREALAGYEENWKDKIPRWRTALTEAANLSGWHILDGYESNKIKEITNSIFRRLKCKRLDAGANLVGIDSRVKEMILRLHMESSDVRIVGIYGVGGIGKTTIAKVIYNKLSCEFECMSFLEDIRGKFNTQGLSPLQNQLLDDILKGEGSQNINSVAHGASMIKDILSSKRVFIVLDDVDDQSQLEYLLRHREWLGEGSRVIITTRNKHVLDVQKVDDLYEVKGLNFEEACELFSLYAFEQNLPKSDYRNLSHRVVGYCQGLPLALKVLGCLLLKKTIPEWESELRKLDREPEAKILSVLKRSYDGLGHTEKSIFLDVACFFKGEDRDFVSKILDACDFHAEIGIKNLNDKCLITLQYNRIHMHDLIQQMGLEIVREKFPDEPNKWSRLWDTCDFERALTAHKGIKKAQTISLDLSKLKRVCSNSNVFAKTTGLRLLKVHSGSDIDYVSPFIDERTWEKVYDVVMKNASKMRLGKGFKFPSYELTYLRWDGYPLDFLPSNFDGGKLVELHLKCSNIKQLRLGNKDLEMLKVIDLSYSRKLSQMSEFSSMPNLERLFLRGCVSLIDIHPSVGNMKKLTTLRLRSCNKLKNLPDSIGDLESLEILDLAYCSKFEKFPEKGGNMKSLTELDLRNSAIKDLPDSIGDLESLEILNLSDCLKFEKFPQKGGNMKSLKQLRLRYSAIKYLPGSIGDLESLEILDLAYCSKFEKFPEKGENMKSLTELDLRNSAIKDLPDSIGDLESLEFLGLSNCSKFEKFPEKGGNMKSLTELNLKNTAIKDLPDSIGDLESLEILKLSNCSKFEKFPEKGGNMKSLWLLDLSNTAIKDLPDSIGDLESLEILDLSNCSKFEKFPEKGGNMKSLTELDLSNTAIKDLPDSIGDLESLEILALSNCSKFEKFPEKGGNMKSLTELDLRNSAIKDLPDSIGDLESLEILNLSDCLKFEKFQEKGGNMKSLKELHLQNTAIKDLPDSIGDLESLEILYLSDCSKFEKFPEKGGNMKSLWLLDLSNTAIKDLPDSIGDLESLEILYLSDCSKFEKFLEKGGNMKSLWLLDLSNTAIKDLPDSIGDLESLEILYLSDCSKFEKFPEKGGNMKSLMTLDLENTAIKDLPDSIGDLESLKFLNLSNSSKFEKLPEKVGNMKSLGLLHLGNTAIKDLPDSIGDLESLKFLYLSNSSKFEKLPEKVGNMKSLELLDLRNTAIKDLPDSIGDLESLEKLSLSNCPKFEVLPLSLKAIDAHLCTSKEDLSRLLWLCHRNWLKSTTEEFDRWQLSAFIPESSGIPEWITYQNLGSEVTEKLPINWCEDPDFPGFVLSCLYRPSPDYDPEREFGHGLKCKLNLHGNGFRFTGECSGSCWCECHVKLKDSRDLVCVYWYPKTAIPEEDHHKYTHINASFKSDEINEIICPCWSILRTLVTMDQHYKIPMVMFMGLIKMMNATIFPC
ncbi:hypothetical protein PVL29_015992 [Vitis rotundifolia]|uniref:ADP-ribosyl cyclase/cyclic ADP-ribose hydrolase n=1 Tax=Vitis rotundifolia TaxID=103349 RepID=A0AA39DJN7_VITRO|nr:hypothetical protein PVL29_015992 [Vitis rotundifolia]